MKRQLIRRIVFCLIIVVLAFFVVKHYDATEYTAGDEQAFISKVCTMSGIPELSIAIWDGDEEEFLNNAGADEHSLYELASTTKAFTGLAVLQLEEQGLIDFDDPVSKYIPEFHPTYQGSEACVTVRHLLNHSSGIPFYMLERFAEEPYNKGGLAKSLSFLYDVKLSFKPGSVHEYSTVNYDLLALIIERVTGTGYEEYVKTNIFDKVGMTESFFRTDAVQPGVTQGYKQAFFFTYPYNAPAYYGNTAAGYLISDTNDLMKWMKNVTSLFCFDELPVTPENNYFAGWNIYEDYVSHAGNNPNYSSQVYVSRTKPLGVFVLSSESGFSAKLIGEGIFKMRQGETFKIGWFYDLYDTVDVAFTLIPLLLLYGICWLPLESKKKAVLRLCLGCLFILAMILIPFVSPIGYRFCFVWYGGNFAFLLGATALISLYLVLRSVIYLKKSD